MREAQVDDYPSTAIDECGEGPERRWKARARLAQLFLAPLSMLNDFFLSLPDISFIPSRPVTRKEVCISV